MSPDDDLTSWCNINQTALWNPTLKKMPISFVYQKISSSWWNFSKEIFNETNQWYRWHHRRGIKTLESLGALKPQTFPKHPDCGWICFPGCGPPGSGPGESKWRGPKRDPQKPAWTQTRPWWCPSWRGWPQARVTRTGFGPKSVAEGEDIQLKQKPKKRYKYQKQ